MTRRPAKRIPFKITPRHAEYLMELIDDDLELDNTQHILKPYEREMAISLKGRLKDIIEINNRVEIHKGR